MSTSYIEAWGQVAAIDLSRFHISALTVLGLAILGGYYLGRSSTLVRLPSVIGYMVLGIVAGPSILNLFDETLMERVSFITDIALGFVAFGIGAELSISALRKLGGGIVSIIFAESFGAFFLVLGPMYLLTRDLPLSLIFASMAPASAPAGTVAVIQETRSQGNLTKALYAVVGFDDGLAIIIFGFAAALAKSILLHGTAGDGEGMMHSMLGPLREIGLGLIVGGVVGLAFCQMVRKLQHGRDILIVVAGAVFVATGLSIQWHLSLIMTNMVVGFVLVNTRRESLVRQVTARLTEVMPLLFVLFFCLAGAHLDLAALPALGLSGLVYMVGRSAGLIGGARLGAMFGKVDEKVKKWVGIGILSQAGVAIGLALIIKQDFGALDAKYGIPHASEIGAMVLTSVTATSIIFGIFAPILTKLALSRAGEIPDDKQMKTK